MPYNPHRSKQLVRQRQRTEAIGAGIKHSEILKRRKIGKTAPVANQLNTPHGFRKEVFECKTFSQVFECLYAGNNTGFGVNFSGDKTIKVERGTVYVSTATVDKNTHEQTNKNIQKIGEGAFINLPRGTAYSLATTGNIDVELLITETAGYSKKWIMLDASNIVQHIDEEATVIQPESTKTHRAGRESTKAKEYAETLAAKRNRKARAVNPSQAPQNGQTVTPSLSAAVAGVNPPLINMAALTDD
jgi:hypothetical protein